MATAIANGRVDQAMLSQASYILGLQGLTVSQAIRELINHIALTGEVPRYAEESTRRDRVQATIELTEFLESLPKPGRELSVSDEELLGEERMARFGR